MNKGTGDTAFIIALVSYLCGMASTHTISVFLFSASCLVWMVVATIRWWDER